MSVPSTLQKTHDECGGTVVFRPATRRRALLAGEAVTLQAACRSCGETLRITWSIAGTDDWAPVGDVETLPDVPTTTATPLSDDAAREVREIEAQLASIAERRAARQRAAARREQLEQAELRELPMAAGAETQWFDPEQYPALARAHRSAIETFDAIEAELRETEAATGSSDDAGALDWRPGSYANMLEVEAEPELAPVPDVEVELEAAVTKPSTRIARGFGATPQTASKEANDEIDAFLGKFADRVARARRKLEHVQTNLPAAVAESQLRTPELLRSKDPVSDSVDVPANAVAEPVVEESPTIALPTFVAEPEQLVAPIEPVTIAVAPEIEPEGVTEAEIELPHAEVEPEATIAPQIEPEFDEAPVAVAPVEQELPAPAPEPELVVEPELEPAPMPEPVVALEPPVVVEAAPAPVAQDPAPVVETPVVAPPAPALPRVELAPPAPVAVEEYPTPLHERVALQSTNDEVFGPRPVAAPELVAEVWGDAPDEPAQDFAAVAAPELQPIPEHPPLSPDTDAVYDAPQPDEGSFGALVADAGSGFDWSDDDAEAPAPAKQRAPKAKRDKGRDKARAKARKTRTRRNAGAKKRPFGSRKPAASSRQESTSTAAPFAAVDSASAVAQAPARVRVRMGLPEVAIVVILAMVAGIAFMKLVSTEQVLPPASDTPVDATSMSATPDGDLVSGAAAPTNAAESSTAGDSAAPQLVPSESADSGSTQDPAAAADTATTASGSASPQSTTPSADA